MPPRGIDKLTSGVGWGATLSGDLAWIEAYNPHIDSYFCYSDASNPHLISSKLVNLSVPFRGLMYYHPDFNGSFKLKSVLPAMFPDDESASYKSLDIQDGEMAMASYARLDRVDDIEEKKRIKESLLAYCELDTLAMVMIWQKLHDYSKTS